MLLSFNLDLRRRRVQLVFTRYDASLTTSPSPSRFLSAPRTAVGASSRRSCQGAVRSVMRHFRRAVMAASFSLFFFSVSLSQTSTSASPSGRTQSHFKQKKNARRRYTSILFEAISILRSPKFLQLAFKGRTCFMHVWAGEA